MAYMEDVGSYYAILLHNSQLRSGLIAEAKRSRRTSSELRRGERLGFALARVFRALAKQIKSRQPVGNETGEVVRAALMHQRGDH